METVTFYGRDKEFNTICIFAPMEVQWNRRYYNVGDFSLQLPIDQYDTDVVYVYCDKRPEIGIVSKTQYKLDEAGKAYVQISGYFYEIVMDNDIIYPAYDGGQNNRVDLEINKLVLTYKSGNFVIDAATEAGTPCDFHAEIGKSLMDQCYYILQLHQMSQRIRYDPDNNKFIYNVWKGLDRTANNSANNNPIVFSIEFGNLKNPDILMDESGYKNYAIVHCEFNDSDIYEVVDLHQSDEKVRKTYVDMTLDSEEELTEQQLRLKMIDAGKTELNNSCSSILNTSFDLLANTYDYMVDFDLGDLVTVNISTIGYNANVRIVAISEVFNSNGHSVKIEVGNMEVK